VDGFGEKMFYKYSPQYNSV